MNDIGDNRMIVLCVFLIMLPFILAGFANLVRSIFEGSPEVLVQRVVEAIDEDDADAEPSDPPEDDA